MARAVEIKLEVKRLPRKEKKTKENRRVRKMKRQRKELRHLVARAGNEIYRRKHRRKATHKEKRIMEELKRKTNGNPNKLKDLMISNKIWFDILRGKIVKMQRYKERDKAIKITASSKKMRETSTRKQMRDQQTKEKYQQWRNS